MGSHTSNDDYEKRYASVEIVVSTKYYGYHYTCDFEGCDSVSRIWYGLAGYSISVCVGYCPHHAMSNPLANMVNAAMKCR